MFRSPECLRGAQLWQVRGSKLIAPVSLLIFQTLWIQLPQSGQEYAAYSMCA
jgi:hypothetical protein